MSSNNSSLPPLPTPDVVHYDNGTFAPMWKQGEMEAYARAAVEAAMEQQDRETASAIRGDSYAGIYVWYGEAICSKRIPESSAKAARDERGLFNFVAVRAIDELMDHALGKAIDHARRAEGET